MRFSSVKVAAFTQTLLLALALAGQARVAAFAEGVSRAPEIWFDPMQSSIDTTLPPGKQIVFSKYDFPAMVASTDQWKRAAANIQVLGIGLHTIQHYPDMPALIRAVGSFKVLIAGSVFYTNKECDVQPSEGFSNDSGYAREFYGALHQWKQEGGRLDYIAMDEPLSGVAYVKRVQDACHFTPAVIGKRSADTVNMILADFPEAQIVSYESPSQIPVPAFLVDYAQFLKGFNAVAHKPISHLGMDLHWDDPWRNNYVWVDAARQIADFAHAHGIKAGLFIDANDDYVESPDGLSVRTMQGGLAPYQQIRMKAGGHIPLPADNGSWMQATRDHLKLAHDQKLPLDFIEIASWMRFPEKNLPENSPEAFTSLVGYSADLYRAK